MPSSDSAETGTGNRERGSAEHDHSTLAAQCPAATREEWSGLMGNVLRRNGRDGGVETLTCLTPERIRVPALYTAVDVPPDGRPGTVGVPG
jgi:hypothetical protein